MIRKMVVIAAAIAIPVSAVTALGAVVGAGVAGAGASPPSSISCTETGTVAIAKPGLTNGGTLTAKSTETTKAALKAAGTGCDTKAIKLSINSTTTPCPPTGGPSACSSSKVAKDPNYYDTALSYAENGSNDVGSSLPLAVTDNGTKVELEYGTATSVSSGGDCGSVSSSDTGFHLTGNVDNSAQTSVLGTYTDTVCVIGDSGKGTTDNFNTDLADDIGGSPNPQSTIAKIVLGGSDSVLAITIP